jgi:hypothetical protein
VNRCLAALLFLIPVSVTRAENEVPNATALLQQMQRLTVLGSVMMIGAHDDDDDTQLLSYLSGELHLRTGYLSLARGTGAQNRIGGERGDAMGVLLTEEALSARRIQNVEQFYTRVFDFGFSKTLEETMARWDRPEMIGDIALIIRRFRPDVVIIRYSGTRRDGHGNHQASAPLARKALAAAADPTQFTEQLKHVTPWSPKRVFQWAGSAATDGVSLEVGGYNAITGVSYGEVSDLSRSAFKSQGMGGFYAPRSRRVYLVPLDDRRESELLSGIETSWRRISGGEDLFSRFASIKGSFNAQRPTESLLPLLEARTILASLGPKSAEPWIDLKLRDVDALIEGCAGLWIQASSATGTVTPGAECEILTQITNRLSEPIELLGATLETPHGTEILLGRPVHLNANDPHMIRGKWKVPTHQEPSQPYWLKARDGDVAEVADMRLIGEALDPPLLQAHFRFSYQGNEFSASRPIRYFTFDPLLGAVSSRLCVEPDVTIRPSTNAQIFVSQSIRQIKVRVTNHRSEPSLGTLRLRAPETWKCEPAELPFSLSMRDQSIDLEFTVTPPALPDVATAQFLAHVNGRDIVSDEILVDYPHIESARFFPLASVRLIKVPLTVAAHRIGYVMGSGDDVPRAIEQMGCEVTLLTEDDLAHRDLTTFDAIVLGIRAYQVRPEIMTHVERLRQFVEHGGTLVMQYTVSPRGPNADVDVPVLAGYPFRISARRITVEDSPVKFIDPLHFTLNYPNKLTAQDFSGWVQERGLHFASSWDTHFDAPLEEQDPGESTQRGGLLVTRYGAGVFIYTAHSWFRQLPAGVPGAYRAFANLLSAGHKDRLKEPQ